MNGFTGLKDLDKEILLKMENREFIQTCGLNKYFRNLCNSEDYLLYKKRLEILYPDVLREKILMEEKKDLSWKQYYGKVVKKVAKLKERAGYDYTTGDLFQQYNLIKKYIMSYVNPSYTAFLIHVLEFFPDEFPLIEYSVKNGAEINRRAIFESLRNFRNLKFLMENGGNYNFLKHLIKNGIVSQKTQEYLHSLGL